MNALHLLAADFQGPAIYWLNYGNVSIYLGDCETREDFRASVRAAINEGPDLEWSNWAIVSGPIDPGSVCKLRLA